MTLIENWKSVSSQSGVSRNVGNDTRQLAKLMKLLEKYNLNKPSIEMSYLTNKNYDQTVILIMKEDGKKNDQ